MTNPDEPPVLVLRTIVCGTSDCSNEGIPIELECAGTVVCGACGYEITDTEEVD